MKNQHTNLTLYLKNSWNETNNIVFLTDDDFWKSK